MPSSTQVSPPQSSNLLPRIRLCLALVITALIFSGLVAFAPIREISWLLNALSRTTHFGFGTPLFEWLRTTRQSLILVSRVAPFLAYSTDRGGLDRLLFALLLLGPYRNPVRNRWVIDFGLVTFAALVVFAFVVGPVRQIPSWWRCADAIFALLCALPLLLCRHYLHLLENITARTRVQRSQKVRIPHRS